ncbi:hypothetical protein GCM10007082_03650 [Oceanisphaera arctica]|nr:hypothetical protein GCM10007082_03650 [Oceanisphaera arctica]
MPVQGAHQGMGTGLPQQFVIRVVVHLVTQHRDQLPGLGAQLKIPRVLKQFIDPLLLCAIRFRGEIDHQYGIAAQAPESMLNI